MSKKKKHDHEDHDDEKDHEKDHEKDPNLRNVYIFGRLENEIAVPVIRRLLRLAERDEKEPINLYINSAGGNGYNADAIIAIMHSIKPPVNTICLGHALSGACEVLASGTGERSAFEYSTLMFHQTIWEAEGDITNLEIQALQGQRFRQAQIELLHKCTGQDREVLRKDIERDFYLSPDEAQKYGLIDKVIRHKGRASKKTSIKLASAAASKKTTSKAKTAASRRPGSSSAARKPMKKK
ncbi:MAG: ATP-dependent Clp protease proteolytic subunit [Candidatus Obscuribacterales bacterium]